MKKYTETQYLMGTAINLTIMSSLPRVDVQNHIDNVYNEFHKVVAKYTRFSESSELGLLNRSNGEFVEVTKELFELVKYGFDLTKKTNGIFDLTIIDLLEAYGYDKNYDFRKLNRSGLQDDIQALLRDRPSYLEIELDSKSYKIRLAKKQRVDLGSIGKGYAISLAGDYLLDNGIQNFLINAGGDIYAHGKNMDQKYWTTALFDPTKSHAEIEGIPSLGTVELKDTALACSGGWARKVGNFHHLLNTATGKSENHVLQVFATGIDPMVTDAFSTILYLMGENGFDLAEENGIDALLLFSDGQTKTLGKFFNSFK